MLALGTKLEIINISVHNFQIKIPRTEVEQSPAEKAACKDSNYIYMYFLLEGI